MIVSDLEGSQQELHLTGHMPQGILNKSSYHLLARSLLSSLYPTMQILEEIPIHIRRSSLLYLDFYIPLTKTAIEVHGEQHYKFIPYYHNDQLGFIRHQKRDREKKDWCEINNIKYIELPFSETQDQWKNRLQ
jgi:hypothetical protein